MANALAHNPCPGVHEIYKFGRSFCDHNCILSLSEPVFTMFEKNMLMHDECPATQDRPWVRTLRNELR